MPTGVRYVERMRAFDKRAMRRGGLPHALIGNARSRRPVATPIFHQPARCAAPHATASSHRAPADFVFLKKFRTRDSRRLQRRRAIQHVTLLRQLGKRGLDSGCGFTVFRPLPVRRICRRHSIRQDEVRRSGGNRDQDNSERCILSRSAKRVARQKRSDKTPRPVPSVCAFLRDRWLCYPARDLYSVT